MVEYSTMNFKITADALTDAEDSDSAPFTGIIKEMIIDFPLGANGLVEVFLYVDGIKVYPDSRTGIAFNNSQVPLPVMVGVGAGKNIKVKIINHDSTNTHILNVVLIIESTSAQNEPMDVFVVGGSLSTTTNPVTNINKDMHCTGSYKGR